MCHLLNICMHPFGNISSSGLAESQGIMCSAFVASAKQFSNVLYQVRSYQQSMRVPVAPYPSQHFVVFVFLALVDVRVC